MDDFLERGAVCEALLHGKWLRGRITRADDRNSEYDIELDDGTAMECIDGGKLRQAARLRGRVGSWDCLERLAVAEHEREGAEGRRPSLRRAAGERDQYRRLEALLGSTLVRSLRDAFRGADSLGEGELDAEDVQVAFQKLRRVADRADILAWLKGRSGPRKRTLDFLEFAKCFAGIFHETEPKAALNPGGTRTEFMENGDDTSAVADWTRQLGRVEVLKMERCFRARCVPFQVNEGTRLGLPVTSLRMVFRDLGYDIAPKRLETLLRSAGLKEEGCVSFVEFCAAFHTLFVTKKQGPMGDDFASAVSASSRPTAVLGTIAETAAAVFAEGQWEGTKTEHLSLQRRLCVGRPPGVASLITKARERFEALDDDGGSGSISSRAAEKLAQEVLKGSKAPFLTFSNEEISLAEWFSATGHAIEALVESEATVASALAQLRLKHAPAEVRGCVELASKYAENARSNPTDRSFWRVATDNKAFATKIGALRGGTPLLRALGFSSLVKKDKRVYLSLRVDASAKTLPRGVVDALTARLRELDKELAVLDATPTVASVLREHHGQSAVEACRVARNCVSNVLKNPADPRLYRLKLSNSLVRAVEEHAPGLWKACGFVRKQDSELLVLQPRGPKPKSSFQFPKLDAETEAFLYRALADLDEAALRGREHGISGRRLGGTTTTTTTTDKAARGPTPRHASSGPGGEIERRLSQLGDDVQKTQLAMARRAFASLDVDEDGVVSRGDVVKSLQTQGKRVDPRTVDAWISARDLDGDGVVSMSDFLASLAPIFALTNNKKKHGGRSEVSDIAAAVGTMRLGLTVREVLNCVEAFEQRLALVVAAPRNSQLWRLRLQPAPPPPGSLEEFIGAYPGALELSRALGFCAESNGQVLALGSGEAWGEFVPPASLINIRLAQAELKARITALEHPDVPDVRAVSSAVGRKLGGDPRQWLLAVELAVRYSRNALQSKQKRKIQTTNHTFRERLSMVQGGLELLVALGWREASCGGYFYFPETNPVEELEARVLELEAGLPFLRVRAAASNKDSVRMKKVPCKTCTSDDTSSKVATTVKKQLNHHPHAPKRRAALEGEKKRELAMAQRRATDAVCRTKQAEARAAQATTLAESLAAQLHEARARKRPVTRQLLKQDASLRKKTASNLGITPKTTTSVLAGVSTFLVEPAVAGSTVLYVANGRGWRCGFKARLSGGEERFVMSMEEHDDDGLMLLHLHCGLSMPQPQNAPVEMCKPTAAEKTLVKRARSIVAAHSVLEACVDAACEQGEALLNQREEQRKFDSRPMVQRRVAVRCVMQRELEEGSSLLVGCLPRLGELYVSTGRGQLLAFGDGGLSLSEARRLFDRLDKKQAGVIRHEELLQLEDEEDLAMLLEASSGAGLTFDSLVAHATRAPKRPKPCADVSKNAADDDVEAWEFEEICWVYAAHAPLHSRRAIKAALFDLEGVQFTNEWPVHWPDGFSCVEDFVTWRLDCHRREFVGDSMTGIGVNGWRRLALLAIRALDCPLEEDGAEFFDRLKQSAACRPFVLQRLNDGKPLGEALRDAILRGELRNWLDFEGVVYGDSKAKVAFRRGPSLAIGSKVIIREVVLDEASSRCFILDEDGVCESWDCATRALLCSRDVVCKFSQGRPLKKSPEAARKMLTLEPLTQIMYFDKDARRLIVNCSAGDCSLRYHETTELECLEKLDLEAPGVVNLVDFKKHGCFGLSHVTTRERKPGSRGSVLAFCLASHVEELLCLSIVGDPSLRLVCAVTGRLEALLTGHSGPITCLARCDSALFSGSTDATIRVWRSASTTRGSVALQRVAGRVVEEGNVGAAWRPATITGFVDNHDVEVEFEDDRTLELHPPNRLFEEEQELSLRKLRVGVKCRVWHSRPTHAVAKFFARYDPRGAGIAKTEDLADALTDLLEEAVVLDSEEFTSLNRFQRLIADALSYSTKCAERVLRGHTGPLTSLVYLESTGLLASASLDSTVRIWEPEPTRASVVAPGRQRHLRSSPGYYQAMPDEWSALPATQKLTIKAKAVQLRSTTLRPELPGSGVILDTQLARRAQGFPVTDRVTGFAYLLKDGSLHFVETTGYGFDDRFVGLELKNAAFLSCVADDGVKVLLSKRRQVERVSYFSTRENPRKLEEFMEAALAQTAAEMRRIYDADLSGDTDFVVFSRSYDDLSKSVEPTITAACEEETAEMLFGLLEGEVKAWAVGRLDLSRSVVGEAVNDDAAVARCALTAWDASYGSWRRNFTGCSRAIESTHRALEEEREEHLAATRLWLARSEMMSSEEAPRSLFRSARRSPKYRTETLRAAALSVRCVFQRSPGMLLLPAETVLERLLEMPASHHCAAWAAETLKKTRSSEPWSLEDVLAELMKLGLERGLPRTAALSLVSPLMSNNASFEENVSEDEWVAVLREMALLPRLDRGLLQTPTALDFEVVGGYLERWSTIEAGCRLLMQTGADNALEMVIHAVSPLRKRLYDLQRGSVSFDEEQDAVLTTSNPVLLYRVEGPLKEREDSLCGALEAYRCTVVSKQRLLPGLAVRCVKKQHLLGCLPELLACASLHRRVGVISQPDFFLKDTEWLFFEGLELGARPLSSMLLDYGAPSEPEVGRLWLRQLVYGLQHAHAHGVLITSLRSEHIIVAPGGGRVSILALSLRELISTAPVQVQVEDVTTPPEALQVLLNDDLVIATRQEVHLTAQWDSWGLGCIARQLAFKRKHFNGYAAQLRRYHAATGRLKGFVYDIEEHGSIAEELKSGWAARFLTEGDWRLRLRRYAQLYDSDSLSEGAVAALLGRLRAANQDLQTPAMSPTAIYHALQMLGFESLTQTEATAIAEHCQGDFGKLETLLTKTEEMTTESLACCLLNPAPSLRPSATAIWRSDFCQGDVARREDSDSHVLASAALYATGATLTPDSVLARVVRPLRLLLKQLTKNEKGFDCSDFLVVCDEALQVSTSNQRDACDLLFEHDVFERCFEFASRFSDIDHASFEVPGPRELEPSDRILALLYRSLGGCLEALATDTLAAVSILASEEASDVAERLCLVAAQLLTDERTRMSVGGYDDTLIRAFDKVAPQYLAQLVGAARSVTRAGSSASLRRGATRALAAVFRGGLGTSQTAGLRAFLLLEIAEFLLPLAMDRQSAQVRSAALDCAHAALIAGFAPPKEQSEAPPESRKLALRFSSTGWVAACCVTIRSAVATKLEREAAFGCLEQMIRKGDLGMRSFGAANAVPALFAARRVVLHNDAGQQDTHEAGGGTNRLLKPFSSTQHVQAHDLLELIANSNSSMANWKLFKNLS